MIYCAGKGSEENGGNAASVGHRYGFGNTEEKHRVKVFGCKERGRPRDGPLDHSTGKGWVSTSKATTPTGTRKGRGSTSSCSSLTAAPPRTRGRSFAATRVTHRPRA